MLVDAVDQRTSQPVTIKVIRPSVAASPAFRREFARRIAVARSLGHPNIASVVGAGEMELNGQPTLFWAVDYLGGGSLRDLFDRGRYLQPSQALIVGLEACRALDAAHQRGIVHGEITPSKLVFGEDRRLRIVDFGLASLLGAAAWADPPTVPTHVARYASPEQALGMTVDATTDVYALSLCLIEAVTGEVPFSADSTVSTLSARVGKLMPVSADLGPLASVLERAGRPEAEDRFTAAEFARALAGAATKLPRPDPVPVLAASAFAASQMRRPTDPTGPLQRPPGGEIDDGGSPTDELAGDDARTPVTEAAIRTDEKTPDTEAAIGTDAQTPVAEAVIGTDEKTPVAEAAIGTDAQTPDTEVGPAGDAVPSPDADAAPAADAAPSRDAEVGPDAGAAQTPVDEEDAADGDASVSEVPDPTGPDEEPPAPTPAAAPADPGPQPGEEDAAAAGEPVRTPGAAVAAAGAAAAVGIAGAARAGEQSSETPAVGDARSAPGDGPAEGPGAPTARDDGPDAAGSTSDGPLVILTDVAGPPPGGAPARRPDDSTVGAGVAGAPAARTSGPRTDVMPATMAPDTTTVLGRTTPQPAEVPYDEERRPRRLGPIILVALVVLLGLGAVVYAGYQLFRTKSYEVPELVGVDESIARNEVAGNDWTIVTEHERSDAQPEIGSVIRTEPVAGTMLDEGGSILFVISDGPELRTLPDFAGDEVQVARDEIYGLALESEVLDAQYSEDVPAGVVISWSVQDNPALEAGAQVLPGTVIELVPSQGPEPRDVPNLVGLNVEQARNELRSLRLRGNRGDDVFSDDVEPGIIVQQSPPAGTSVERGSRVGFQVSKGPDLVALPDLEDLTYPEAEAALLDAGFTIGDVLGTTEGTFVSLSVDGEEAGPGATFRRGTAVDLIFL